MIEKSIIITLKYIYKLLGMKPYEHYQKIAMQTDIIFNIMQLSLMVEFSILLSVRNEFIVQLIIYFVVRHLGIALHFMKADTCFYWSNLLFLPEIVCLSILKSSGYDLELFIVFFGIINGLALSKDNKIVGLFAYKKNDKQKVKVKINRNEIRNILYKNFETDQVQKKLKSIQETTEVDVIPIATFKYKELLSNAEIAQETNYTEATIKLVDYLLFAGFSDFKG